MPGIHINLLPSELLSPSSFHVGFRPIMSEMGHLAPRRGTGSVSHLIDWPRSNKLTLAPPCVWFAPQGNVEVSTELRYS